jgi:hypothetical protein
VCGGNYGKYYNEKPTNSFLPGNGAVVYGSDVLDKSQVKHRIFFSTFL